MRLYILVAARPRFSIGSTSQLGVGRWHLVGERIRDSAVLITINKVPLPAPIDASGNGHHVDGPCLVETTFAVRGTEPYINIYAESSNGSKS